MTNNHHLLRNWAAEAAPALTGSEIVEVYTQRKHELNIGLLGKTEIRLEISIQPDLQYVLMRDRHSRQKRNSADLFPEARLKKIASLQVVDLDRVLVLDLQKHFQLVIQLIGRNANVFLVNGQKVIIAAFKDPQKFINETWELPIRGGTPRAAGLVPGFEKLAPENQNTVRTFDKLLLAEFKSRMAGSTDIPDTVSQMKSLMKSGKSYLYRESGNPVAISPLPLDHLTGTDSEVFDGTNEALTLFVNHQLKNAHRIQLLKETQRSLKSASSKKKRALEQLQKELENAETYPELELMGNLLTINIRNITRGASTASVQNIYAPNAPLISIPLNPEKNAADNIKRYFTRAKKLKTGLPKIKSRIAEIRSQLKTIEDHQKLLKSDLPKQSIEELVGHLRNAGLLPKVQIQGMKTGAGTAAPFRSFYLGGDWTVYVGQNNARNEMLTFEFAAKHDYWFHARGVPGSHVVLRHAGGVVEPPKPILEKAAAIAAHFSKARTSGLVPVICTQRKYVRKIKGAEKGKVRVDREEVLIVPPLLPPSQKKPHR